MKLVNIAFIVKKPNGLIQLKKRRLKINGIYTLTGTINMYTAYIL